MPAAQLACAAIEAVLNALISFDRSATSRGKALQSKRVGVTLAESPWPLAFQFDADAPLTVRVHERVDDDSTPVDCEISLSISTLSELSDASQITGLIKQGRLNVDGDIQVAQAFSQLLGELDIDWEEQLASRTNDVFAHQLFSSVKSAANGFSRVATSLHNTVRNAVLEEKPIAAHPIAIAHFSDQVDALRQDTDRLMVRLEQLENSANSPQGKNA
ncbi:ubiquinone biosynthesis accessory factor UbiJ [Aestuariibacter salexigens]|uniref:ubiquinone biosynthesis accessory factor UbiJ n=1 Tax=Aestuariibacter salexigens TaxID=226010 RepID=UPI000410DE4E|nr:SCP2 sterol-binding domain-containing protein [Aestuariibacter salexigens]